MKTFMHRRAGHAAAVSLLTLLGANALATPTVIEPDDYAAGTDLSYVVPGVVLETLYQPGGGGNRWNPVVGPVYSGLPCGTAGALKPCTVAPTGVQLFATAAAHSGYEWKNSIYADGCHRIVTGSGTSGYCNTGFNVLSVRFASGVSSVSLDGVWVSDPVWIYAYNSAGQLIASCRGPNEATNPSCYTPISDTSWWDTGTVTVSSAAADIAWIIAGSDNGVAGIDRLVFE